MVLVTTTIKSYLLRGIAALVCAALFSSSALAASINYGDFADIPSGSITFTQVIESSGTDPVPLYGAPIAVVNDLEFNPLGFTSNSTGGGADITDGQLNFGLMAEPGTAFSDVGIAEFGDYTLFGSGTAITSVGAGLFIQVTITEVDGSPIVPVVAANVNVSVAFDLIADPGLNQPWSLAASIDIEQFLVDEGIGFVLGATKADVVLNNTLASISEASSVAFIAKKGFVVDVTVVPEPTTAMLAVFAFTGLGLIAGRRRLR